MTTPPRVHPRSGTSSVLDEQLPAYDMALTQHLVVDADPERVYDVARNFDFMTVRSPVVTALMTVRTWPSMVRGHAPEAPAHLLLAARSHELPGWLVLGEEPGREVVFGAIGTFWTANIRWRDTTEEDFASMSKPGWGKIACHLLVRPDGEGRSVLTYECRTATTDAASRRAMSRYWFLIRPVVDYMLRAVLRSIRHDAERSA